MLSERGVSSARVPEAVACRIWLVEVGGVEGAGASKVEDGASGMVRREGSVVVVEGKWPVWKVARGRRRVPERDLGSGERWLVVRLAEGGG